MINRTASDMASGTKQLATKKALSIESAFFYYSLQITIYADYIAGNGGGVGPELESDGPSISFLGVTSFS